MAGITSGVTYTRFVRKGIVKVYEDGSEFPIGKGVVLHESDKDVATIITSGIMVDESLKAYEALQAEGISVRVIDMFTWKPLDEELVIKAAKETGAIVTAENHNVTCGLGSVVSNCLAKNCPTVQEFVGVQDLFGQVGPQDFLMDEYGLRAANIVAAVKKAISRNKNIRRSQMAMDLFSASLMADKRSSLRPTVYKFQTFAQMAEEFKLGERDVVLTNEFIYTPFMKELGLKCNFVFQEKFGAGEPSEAMIQTMYDAIPYDSYDRVIAVGGGAIMDLCKLLGCKRPDTVHNLYFKRFPVVHEKDVIAIPTTCGTGSECTNISVAIVKDEKDGVLTGGETKLGLVSDDIIPNKVCLIPDLLKTLPYKPFACSAIDALVHATESFLSPHRKTMTSELFSEKAMDMILKGFKLIDEKGQDARFEYLDEFVTASFYAGIAFLKAGCGPVHGMSFPLGGTYHVPHGESNYALRRHHGLL